jgi:5-methylcytosine-specific restriction protein B
MMPKTNLLKIEVNGIKIDELLKKINERIEFLYDRDHTIGHAYFMKLKDNPDYKELCSIFANKIIPLLQEYFYEDWEKIQIVLGDHKGQKNKKKDDDKMIICEEISETDVIGFNHPEIDEKRCIYSINKKLVEATISPETFTTIYESTKKPDEEDKGSEL